MAVRIGAGMVLIALACSIYFNDGSADACCLAPRLTGELVLNADQTVIIIWDVATKTQHFIRRASFRSEADDFGFLVPSPTQPELSESGDEAFPLLRKLTEPEIKRGPGSMGIGCAMAMQNLLPEKPPGAPPVIVLEETTVAGYQAAVLETKSGLALVQWLKDHGYAYSPEMAAWAKPYIDRGWKITALKVAKSQDGKNDKHVAVGTLRMSFKTERPLFPYREPDYKDLAAKMEIKRRTLRIYFIAEARYDGGFWHDLTSRTKSTAPERPANYTGPWSGKVVWAGKVKSADRDKILEQLKLPKKTGPSQWWLTEFEDNWPYKLAFDDVHFDTSLTQESVKRDPIYSSSASNWPTDLGVYALAAVVVVPALRRWGRRDEAAER